MSRFLLPLLLGVAFTLTLRGYQFGGGNHAVYLIEPLREVHPELLANDWWATHTLQYHVAFNRLTALLMRMQIVEPAFLVFYLGLAVLLHVGWLRLVWALGLDARVYVLSVLLYYLSAGGTGLGSYQFLQDSSFLPGNLANVAMLWGIVLWVEGRMLPAAGALAVASLFHLNHALIALAFWPVGVLFARWRGTGREHGRAANATSSIVSALLSFGLILFFALPNVLPAARLALSHAPKMPLKEFVDLYVHLRHPHHYDPLSWPVALWVSFLWPMPLAVVAYRRRLGAGDSLRRAAVAFTFFMFLQLVALLFAGILFVSESLIQMSLFRFSIYPKLLSCVGAAAFLLDPALVARKRVRAVLVGLPVMVLVALVGLRVARPTSAAGLFVGANYPVLLLFVGLLAAGVLFVLFTIRAGASALLVCVLLATVSLTWNRWLGLQIALSDDGGADYLQICRWAREHTPADAVFLVPPNEQLFRYHSQRAIVVNFKNVPQLASEMTEWRERLEAVLYEPLSALPRRFDQAHAAIAARYNALPLAHLAAVAQRYGARYIVTAHPIPGTQAVFENAAYHLYDLRR